MKTRIISLFLFFTLAILLPVAGQAGETIKLASTTSTKNSGLLDYLLPLFKGDSGIDVEVTVVGSGDALELGKKGEVDCVLTHAKEMELELLAEGYFLDRHDIMYDDFIILGPKNDPADIKTMQKVSAGFNKIRSSQAPFISRGDNSETNMWENRIWASTGRMPGRMDKWYYSVGLGMTEAIRVAAAKQGYTIADRATWATMEDRQNLNLEIVLEKDPALFNQYGAMIVNQQNHPEVEYRLAMNFIIWLTSARGQEAIASYKTSSGDTLFIPNAD